LRVLTTILTLFSIPSDKPELVLAQLRAFSKQIPLLYFLLIINTGFVAYTHLNHAPLLLTVFAPSVFSVICVGRLYGWWQMRNADIDSNVAAARLRSTLYLSASFGLLMTIWGLSIFPYGGSYEKAHVAFFMSITTLGCVFCLMHLRAAALTLSLVTVIPFGAYFATLGNPVMSAIAVNMLLVTGGMIFILSTHYKDFATMVDQKVNLEKTHQETKRLSDENHKFANLDSLTELPNRRRFFSELESWITKSEKNSKSLAVGLIDLDGFKAVNDLYGHGVGDALLIEASIRMRSCEHWPVFLARLGGDEFGFILECDNHTESAIQFGSELCEILRLQYVLGDLTADVSASCGIAMFPDNGKTATKLLEYADYALYQAKSEATGGVIVFTPKHHEQLRSVHQINQALRNADLDKELSLEFQPVIDVSTGLIISLEALARWNSPVVGIVPPSTFIVTAERSNLIDRLTLVLFQKFLKQLSTWPEHIVGSFNLSARNLASPETALQIVAAIRTSGVSPKQIEFEVTETAVMVDYDRAMKTLTLLRNLGTSIALDDFGTGYSSLGYVHRLPLDKIKIDRGFMPEIESSEKAQNIVRTIVDLCRNLGVPCIAEGVETRSQARAVSDSGCNLMQGYFFSKPVKAAKVPHLLQSTGSLSVKNKVPETFVSETA
jgi:diguanylate cyclase (GGDEF)-like protein